MALRDLNFLLISRPERADTLAVRWLMLGRETRRESEAARRAEVARLLDESSARASAALQAALEGRPNDAAELLADAKRLQAAADSLPAVDDMLREFRRGRAWTWVSCHALGDWFGNLRRTLISSLRAAHRALRRVPRAFLVAAPAAAPPATEELAGAIIHRLRAAA